MQIVKLSMGETASKDTDCIRFEKLSSGGYGLTGSASVRDETSQDESVSMTGEVPYDTYEQAEAAGLAWAADQGVQILHVETCNA